jgi:hypothetical protein
MSEILVRANREENQVMSWVSRVSAITAGALCMMGASFSSHASPPSSEAPRRGPEPTTSLPDRLGSEEGPQQP